MKRISVSITVIIYFLPYSDFYIIYPSKEEYLDLPIFGMFKIIENVFIELSFLLFSFIFMCQYFSGDMGYYVLIIFTIINSLGLLIDKNNKYYETDEQQ